jgi:hypothetical protein
MAAAWWGWISFRERRRQRAMALRRMEVHKRDGVFYDGWEIDFVEMRMLYSYCVYDYPGVEVDVVYAMRRCGVSHWEKQMLWDSADLELRRLEREAQESDLLKQGFEERRQTLLTLRDMWTRIGSQLEAQMETHYQLFLARYESVEPSVSLEEYWRRIIALRHEREQRAVPKNTGAA